ncbi:MAG: retropepsin-like domain-containing protein [Blastocatellia bacterium]|nr:retropepsin-like domain-containing protein [Blastocatellia bacterium]
MCTTLSNQAMRYKYQRIRSKQDPNIVILEPIIPVGLRYKDKRLVVTALIDSGAELCLFHSSVGKALGIDLHSGREEHIKGIALDVVPAYMHKIQLVLRGEPAIDMEVGFMELDLIPDGGLLGQQGFFDEFDIRFQRWQNAIHITRRKGWKTR